MYKYTAKMSSVWFWLDFIIRIDQSFGSSCQLNFQMSILSIGYVLNIYFFALISNWYWNSVESFEILESDVIKFSFLQVSRYFKNLLFDVSDSTIFDMAYFTLDYNYGYRFISSKAAKSAKLFEISFDLNELWHRLEDL